MKDDNLKLEVEEKLRNIITRIGETDIDSDTIRIFCASLHGLLEKYHYRRSFGKIGRNINRTFRTCNSESFKLLIDMLEEKYL